LGDFRKVLSIRAETRLALLTMTSMNRVKVTWSGWQGQPGLSTFYLTDSTLDVTALKNFFSAMAVYVPNGIVMTIPALGDKIIAEDASIGGSWSGTGGGTVNGGGGTGTYAGSAGVVVDWLTGTLVNRRRVMGRTYFVPGGPLNLYENNGTIGEGARTAIVVAANAMISAYSGAFLVWSRPFTPDPKTNPPVGDPGHKVARAGTTAPVLAARVPDIAAVQRSRRQ